MNNKMNRRNFLRLTGLGGVVFSTGLLGARDVLGSENDEFYFVQFSDTHYGFNKAKINPDPVAGLNKAIDEVNRLKYKPDFVMFTGDLTHNVDDPGIRRQRMQAFEKIISRLNVKDVRMIPGEHDASLDNGLVYKEVFGATHYSFKHKGILFIALDNVSDPRGQFGLNQLAWLDQELAGVRNDQPIVVFAHRPLFSLYPQWGWATLDGQQVINRLSRFKHVTVFYGHIHQEHHHKTGRISHHSAQSLIFPLPKPGSTEKRKPLAWDDQQPFKGLGVRQVEAYGGHFEIDDIELG